MKNKYFKIIGGSLITIILIIVISISIFLFSSYEPSVEALAKMEDSNAVDVTVDDLLIFEPQGIKVKTGLIIYPGAKVEAEAYAPLANKIAQEGYKVIIAPMPLNFAIFDEDAADKIIERFNEIENWAISGHSLGGVMATKYASKNNKIEGVILYASYPQGDEIKNLNIEVASIYGSNDGVINKEKIIESKNLLPATTDFIKIDGGNHAGFGSYGEQKGDNPLEISGDNQIEITAKATIDILEKISNN